MRPSVETQEVRRLPTKAPLWPGQTRPVRCNAPSAEIQDLKDRYMAWMMATGYAEDSLKAAHSDLEWLFRFLAARGIARIADVTPEILNDYSLWFREHKSSKNEGQTLSLMHVAQRLTGVRQFFKWLAKQMIVLYDPAEDLEVPKIHRGLPRTILTQEEARRLLDAPDLESPVGYRDKALLELLYATGVRTKELIRLKVEDVNLKDQTIFIRQGKYRKDRLIPVPVVTAGYLKEYIERVRPRFIKSMYRRGEDQGFLFLSYTGTHFLANRLKDIFKRAKAAAGIDKPVTAMVLRHSIASHLLENGMEMRYIQEFLGHERMVSTQVYAKVTLSGLRKHYNKAHPKERRAGAEKIAPSDAKEAP
jgi:integrase/recombinase XerD